MRRAGVGDAAALVRLRAVMLDAVGEPTAPDAPWRAAALGWFTDRLTRPAELAAFVVEDPGAGVVAVACGTVESRPPGPRTPNGVRGHVFNVATEAAWRRRGHARACLVALLAWYEHQTPAAVVELAATAEGQGLYRSLGFTEVRHPTLRLRLQR